MFTLTVKLPHLQKRKTYYFENPEEAEKYADILQAEGILGTLGFDRNVVLDLSRANREHVDLIHLH